MNTGRDTARLQLYLNKLRLIIFSGGDLMQVISDEKASVTISKDLISAFITFKQPEGGELLTYDQLVGIVDGCGVVYGVDHEKLRHLAGNPDKPYNEAMQIASGEAPVDGDHAKFKFKFKIARDKTPKVLPDGSVDHRVLEYAESVHKGDVLAEIDKETSGRPGMSVLGNEIPAKHGKPKPMIQGKNTELSEDGLRLIAAEDGLVQIVGSKITIIPELFINGDIGPGTGHITFTGDVKIRGNVLTGYNVSAEGNVYIKGCVEAAEVRAGGDIVIEQGVKGFTSAKGPGGVLHAKGNITSKFFEGAIVTANGVIRADTILNSTVASYASVIISGRKGNVTGGATYAFDEIICDTTGSNSGIKTQLMIGLTEAQTESYKTIEDDIDTLRENMEREKKIIELDSSIPLQAKRKYVAEQKMNYYKILVQDKIDQKAALENVMGRKTAGRIKVNKTAYPPVEITIGKLTYLFDFESVYNSTFCVIDGSIVASPNY